MTNIRTLGANKTVLSLGAGDEVFFSYETPVAAFFSNKFYKTTKKYSVTTSRHINEYLGGCKDPIPCTPEFLSSLVNRNERLSYQAQADVDTLSQKVQSFGEQLDAAELDIDHMRSLLEEKDKQITDLMSQVLRKQQILNRMANRLCDQQEEPKVKIALALEEYIASIQSVKEG